MNFKEQLKQIENYTLEDCLENQDYMIDYEHLHLEQAIKTGYKHHRLTNFTDKELLILAEANHKKIMEIL